MARYVADGLDGLIDKRLEQVSNRRAPVDDVVAMTEEYRRHYTGWNVNTTDKRTQSLHDSKTDSA